MKLLLPPLSVLVLLVTGAPLLAQPPPASQTVDPPRAEAGEDSGALQWQVDALKRQASHAVAGGVILRRDGQADVFFPPLEQSDPGRAEALRSALATAQLTPLVPATIELRRGRFTLKDDATLLSANPARNSTIRFGPDSALVYADPEDAATDYQFFRGPRNVVNFGAIPALNGAKPVENLPYFQAAANSLSTRYPNPPHRMPSGRWLRNGEILIPAGEYCLAGEWEVSPTVTVSGAGTDATILRLSPGAFPKEDGRYLLHFPIPSGVDVNNIFGTGVRDLTLYGERGTNPGGSGLKISGGQGTHIRNVNVHEFAQIGVDANGLHIEGGSWIANITRGPGLRWRGGGTARLVNVEHVNPRGLPGPDGLRYPAVEILDGTYHIGAFFGEEEGGHPQTLCRATNTVSLNIGTMVMGVAAESSRTHIVLDVRGTTRARVDQLQGSYHGAFETDPGTLVQDISTHSPAGSGEAYLLDGASGTYRQRHGPPTLSVTDGAGFGGAVPQGMVGGVATALNVTGYSGLGGLRVNGQDGANTIFQPGGPLAITTNQGGELRLGVGVSASQFRITPAGQIVVTLPPSPAGLPSGALWRDGNLVRIVE